MFITVEATYESGVLKLRQPLPLDEHETVRVTVETDKAGPTGSAGAIPRHEPALTEPAATDPAHAASPPADEPSDFAESELLNIWLNVPPSPTARTVIARRGPLPLPDPPVIPPDDDEIG
jgi:hypothetical protein